MPEIDWQILASGNFTSPIMIGEIDEALCEVLGCSDQRVWIGPECANKLREKHLLSAEQLRMMPICLSVGMAIRDTHNAITFVYDDLIVFSESFFLVVKTTGERHELWVSSFRRIREKDKRGKLAGREILRPHI